MKVLTNSIFPFIFWLAFVLFAAFLQSLRFGEIGGAAPNFLLIVFLLPVFFQVSYVKRAAFIISAVLASIFFFPFWAKEIVLLGALALSSLLLRRFLFDRPVLDFSLLFLGLSLLFYLLLDFGYLFGNLGTVLKEIGLGLIFAAAIALLLASGWDKENFAA